MSHIEKPDPTLIEHLLMRNIREVFGEGDPVRLRKAIEDIYTDDCVVYLPIGRYVGHDELASIAGALRASHPTYIYTPHRKPDAVQNGGRLIWGSGPLGEPPRYTGEDIIVVRDSKIAVLYVFLDSQDDSSN
ncbi:nuclear transport factor 2 family protein [Paraburkholderia bannensis]|uniref:nuclear transport factor 2 family protein n=1 Tax=Paraburkholderia bannensis TaxID=765414 RepID=UPI002ABD2CB6|nr:nuclear transport factor 2 family protein [Paraburkholderia bannensis]